MSKGVVIESVLGADRRRLFLESVSVRQLVRAHLEEGLGLADLLEALVRIEDDHRAGHLAAGTLQHTQDLSSHRSFFDAFRQWLA